MSQSLDFFVLSCLLLTAEAQQGQISLLQNVSLIWISDFEPQLSWAPPQHPVENCKYKGFSKTMAKYSKSIYKSITQPWRIYTVMEGGFLHMNVSAVCDDNRTVSADINVTYPDLVRNLQCYIHAAQKTHCSWLPASQAPDLRFFYRLLKEDFTVSADDKPTSIHVQECPSYCYSGGTRTGCDLEADTHHSIHILVNGTLNNKLVRNTFKKELFTDLKPPPLKWTVTKSGSKFYISWIPPDIAGDWTITINYTECNDVKIKQSRSTVTSTVLDLVPQCPYRMAIKASTDEGETPWSEEKYFDAETDPKALLYVAIIIPLMFTSLVVLLFVCCRKNKKNIFPKIPEPRDFLSDISDNNNKSALGNLYIPAEEEHNCKITLVVDHLTNKPDL